MSLPDNYTGLSPLYCGRAAPPSGLPLWMAGKPLNEWFAIANTAGADGATIDPWCGFAINQSTGELFYALSGGHGDSTDTRVSSIVLFDDAPAYKSPRRKNTIASNLYNANQPYSLDGVTPTSRHTRYQLQYCPQNNRLMLMGSPSLAGTGASSVESNGFDLATNTWDAPGTWASGSNNSVYGTSIDDQGNIWCRLAKWIRATNTFVNLPNTYYSTSAFDPVRRQLFTLTLGDGQGGSLGLGIFSKTISEDLSLTRTITFNASAAWTEFQSLSMTYCAITYDPLKDLFYYYPGYGFAGAIYIITPNTGTVWDMSKMVRTGADPTETVSAGINARFQYVNTLKGIVMVPRQSSNIYFMRTA